MAKFVAIQLGNERRPFQPGRLERWADAWGARFSDGLVTLTPRVRYQGGRTGAILFDDESGWAEIGEDYLFLGSPSRSRALSGRGALLVRLSPGSVAARTDVVASRAVWYGHHGGVSVVSNSLRAAVSVLRRFRPNEAALGWMLAAGNLGPGNSWSLDIRKLQPCSEVVLGPHGPPEVASWGSSFPGSMDPSATVQELLREALDPVRDHTPVALLLSGGVDSRVLLGTMRDSIQGLSTITWGAGRNATDPASDVSRARELAARAGIPHVFLPIDLLPNAELEGIVRRFVKVSDGAVDWIAGYVDGLASLSWLSTANLTRVVRGDLCFGAMPVIDSIQLRRLVHAEQTTDHPILRRWSGAIPDVSLAAEYERRDEEQLSDWRDRLYRSVMIPCTLASLSEIKTCLVEQYSPFLDPGIVALFSRLPPRLRDRKPILQQLAADYFAGTAFAARPSLPGEGDLLANSRLGPWVDASVAEAAEVLGLPAEFARDLILKSPAAGGIRAVAERAARRPMLRRFAPARLVRRVRSAVGPLNAPPRRIGLRLILASRALEMFAEDASFGVDPCTPETSGPIDVMLSEKQRT